MDPAAQNHHLYGNYNDYFRGYTPQKAGCKPTESAQMRAIGNKLVIRDLSSSYSTSTAGSFAGTFFAIPAFAIGCAVGAVLTGPAILRAALVKPDPGKWRLGNMFRACFFSLSAGMGAAKHTWQGFSGSRSFRTQYRNFACKKMRKQFIQVAAEQLAVKLKKDNHATISKNELRYLIDLRLRDKEGDYGYSVFRKCNDIKYAELIKKIASRSDCDSIAAKTLDLVICDFLNNYTDQNCMRRKLYFNPSCKLKSEIY